MDLEAGDNVYGETRLHLAALKGHIPVAQYLYEQRVGKQARGRYGRMPLRYAAQYVHHPTVPVRAGG